MKNKIVQSAIVAIAFFGTYFTANAGLISGSHLTADGKVVALQNLEWMSLDYTAGLSRVDVEDGFTDRYGTSWNAGEWTYATRQQTETLLHSLWGSTYGGWSQDNGDGATWFLETFGGLGYDIGYGVNRFDRKINVNGWLNYDFSQFLYGAYGDCGNSSTDWSCNAYIEAGYNYEYDKTAYTTVNSSVLDELSYTANSGKVGYFWAGLSHLHNHNTSSSNRHSEMGSLLVRVVDVPEPSILSILVLGLMALGLRRKKEIK
jgi:hypothetical protein